MRTPISYALAWPERLNWTDAKFDLAAMEHLSFAAVDIKRFPCFGLARQALCEGGAAPAVLNAANEVAVDAFLKKLISFNRIQDVVHNVLDRSSYGVVDSLGSVTAVDDEARFLAFNAVKKYQT